MTTFYARIRDMSLEIIIRRIRRAWHLSYKTRFAFLSLLGFVDGLFIFLSLLGLKLFLKIKQGIKMGRKEVNFNI